MTMLPWPTPPPPCVYCGKDDPIVCTPDGVPATDRWFQCTGCGKVFIVRFTPAPKKAERA